LWLQGVAELVANDGFITQGAETTPKPRRSLVKRGALLGAMLMFIGGLFITLPANDLRGDKALFAFFFYGVALMLLIGVSGYVKRLFTKIFSEEAPSPSKKITYTLPATHIAPVVDAGRQSVDTMKAPQLSSVTEQTTSRLNNV
jgi:hypothetical protein